MEWRPVVGFEERYEVSDAGLVRSVDRVVTDSLGRVFARRGKVLSPSRNAESGHLRVNLDKRTYFVHRLMLTAFVRPPEDGEEARHLNGVPDDNRLENLKWGTRSENQQDSLRHGTQWMARRTHCANNHPLSGDNLLVYKSQPNRRWCRTCKRKANRDAQARRRTYSATPGDGTGGRWQGWPD